MMQQVNYVDNDKVGEDYCGVVRDDDTDTLM